MNKRNGEMIKLCVVPQNIYFGLDQLKFCFVVLRGVFGHKDFVFVAFVDFLRKCNDTRLFNVEMLRMALFYYN